MPKNLDNTPEKLQLYIFHGVDLEPPKRDWVKGDCPFCGKEGHFFVSQSTGKFKCQRCRENGNQYSFLATLLELSLKHTSADDYQQLAEARKPLTVNTLQEGLVAKSYITGEWLIPAYNPKGSLANIYKAVEVQGKDGKDHWVVYSSPNCKVHPFGRHLFPKDLSKVTRLRVHEGPWDYLAVWQANKNRPAKLQCHILGTPGTNSIAELKPYLDGTFREPTLPLKRLDICFDNDHAKRRRPDDDDSEVFYPGWDGQQALLELISQNESRPSKVNVTDWRLLEPKAYKPHDPKPEFADGVEPCNSDLPDGFDARDLLRKMPRTGMATLDKLLIPGFLTSPTEDDETPAVEPLPCDSFQDLLKYWDKTQGGVLFMTQQIQDCLHVALATCISTPLGGDDQLWFRLIGPPGSAKSTIAEAMSVAKEWVYAKSIVRGFHSGYTGGGRGARKAASLVPLIRNKMVCIKDADTLTQSPNFAGIMSELRDIYDKVSRAAYRNEQGGDFEDLPTTFLLCGTDHLRANIAAHSFLGERFLDIEIAGDEEVDPIQIVAQDNEYQQIISSLPYAGRDVEGMDKPDEGKLMILKRRTYGFLRHLKIDRQFKPPVLPPEHSNKIRIMAKLLACLRTRVHRDGADLMYRPRSEKPYRLTKQLTRLAVCLALVMDKPAIDEDIMRIVKKVVHDTAHGFQYEVLVLLSTYEQEPPKMINGKLVKARKGTKPAKMNGTPPGFATTQICRRLGLPETNVRRLLSNLQELKLVTRRAVSNNSGQRGRDTHVWTLTPDILSLFQEVSK